MPLNNFDRTARLRRCPRAAFTLIELLVVIGIIAVLAGVMAVAFGGATETARAAQCLSNMKSLAQAANATAMSGGWYPAGGGLRIRRHRRHEVGLLRGAWVDQLALEPRRRLPQAVGRRLCDEPSVG